MPSKPKRIAIVVSDFNDEITGRMEAVALQAARRMGAKVAKVVHVPGAYDIPIMASALAGRKDIDAVACLGAVVKGETKHDELICHACAHALTRISLKTGKPVALGVIGPGVTHPQAVSRADGYARRAVEGAIRLLDALDEAKKRD